jgi:hypothetical protein
MVRKCFTGGNVGWANRRWTRTTAGSTTRRSLVERAEGAARRAEARSAEAIHLPPPASWFENVLPAGTWDGRIGGGREPPLVRQRGEASLSAPKARPGGPRREAPKPSTSLHHSGKLQPARE